MSKYGSMRRPASKISTKKQIASVQKSFVRGVLILFLATLMIVFIFGDFSWPKVIGLGLCFLIAIFIIGISI